MKKMIMRALMLTIAGTAKAFNYSEARSEALFLSDKMAYELNLTAAQYDAVYEINLDYYLSVGTRNDLYGSWWTRRNTDLKYVLTAWQYEKYASLGYFYRPVSWVGSSWTFNIYSRYTNRTKFYNSRPTVYVSYRGGNNRAGKNYYATRDVRKPATQPKYGNAQAGNRNTAGNRQQATAKTSGSFGNHANGTPASGHNTQQGSSPTWRVGSAGKQVAQNTSHTSGSFGAHR